MTALALALGLIALAATVTCFAAIVAGAADVFDQIDADNAARSQVFTSINDSNRGDHA